MMGKTSFRVRIKRGWEGLGEGLELGPGLGGRKCGEV